MLAAGRRVQPADLGVLADWQPTPKFYDVNNGAFDTVEEAFVPFARGQMRVGADGRVWLARAMASDATTQDVTSLATWSSADVTGTGVASVDAAGRATGTAVGRATITATYLGFTDSASLTVTAAVPMSAASLEAEAQSLAAAKLLMEYSATLDNTKQALRWVTMPEIRDELNRK